MITSVRLTTEITDDARKDRTDVYPHNYFRDKKTILLIGFKQIKISNFSITENSRVQMFFFQNPSNPISITGNDTIKLPTDCNIMIFAPIPLITGTANLLNF
jgi:hypothetical protein